MTREEIVAEARSYLGTRFHHMGRMKHVGVDCVGLILGVVQSFGAAVDYADIPYPAHPSAANGVMAKLSNFFIPVPEAESRIGDVLVFWAFRRTKVPHHLGIKTDYGIIHAYPPAGRVVEHRMNKKWIRRVCGAFQLRGAE